MERGFIRDYPQMKSVLWVGFTLELQRASKDILYAVSNTWKMQ